MFMAFIKGIVVVERKRNLNHFRLADKEDPSSAPILPT